MTKTNEQGYVMPDEQLVIKARVSMARLDRELSKLELAKMLTDNGYKISDAYYGQKEHDPRYRVQKSFLVALANLYNIHVETFLYGQLTKPKHAPKLEELSEDLTEVIEKPKGEPVTYELIEEPREISENRKKAETQLDNDFQTLVNVKSYFETVVSRMKKNISSLKGDD